MKFKIAAVIQRYGTDVVGGGEVLCRQVAQRLAAQVDVTVLTSCAQDYVSWSNQYPAGEHRDGPVRVLRFPVRLSRPVRLFHLLSTVVLARRWPILPRANFLQGLWVRAQGPYCPGLVRHIRRRQSEFDAFLFFTYLYYPTVFGIPFARPKAILIPTAHDERPIRLPIYREVFRAASALIYLSPEERDFANQAFGVEDKPQRISTLGLPGLDQLGAKQEPGEAARAAFARRHGLEKPYLLYLGRIDSNKGCGEMFSHFLAYLRDTRAELILALAGQKQMAIPESPSIRYLGYLSEADKQLALAGCRALVLLSPYESYSIVLQEAFAWKRPAIVSARSAVLKGHIERSRGGYAVDSYAEFREAAHKILSSNASPEGENGYRYLVASSAGGALEDSYMELIRLIAGRAEGVSGT